MQALHSSGLFSLNGKKERKISKAHITVDGTMIRFWLWVKLFFFTSTDGSKNVGIGRDI